MSPNMGGPQVPNIMNMSVHNNSMAHNTHMNSSKHSSNSKNEWDNRKNSYERNMNVNHNPEANMYNYGGGGYNQVRNDRQNNN